MPIILGITGLKGVGKSEASKYLAGRYGFTVIALADPLKSMLRAIGLTEAQINGEAKELPCNQLQGCTPRHAMQTLGTEWGRMMIADNFWTALWRTRVEACRTPVVVDDARFENEFNMIKSMGGKMLRITRPGVVASKHISETSGFDLDVDYGITNKGRLTELHRAVDHAIQVFRFPRPAPHQK